MVIQRCVTFQSSPRIAVRVAVHSRGNACFQVRFFKRIPARIRGNSAFGTDPAEICIRPLQIYYPVGDIFFKYVTKRNIATAVKP